VVDTVRRNPAERARLECQRAENAQCVFKPLRHLESAVRQQSVIAKADAEAARHPPKNGSGKKICPAKRKKCGDRQNVKYNNSDESSPV
jgi:hypothetical protein